MDTDAILSLLTGFADRPLLLTFAIVIATFGSEDAATVAVGVLASQALVSVETALIALLIGTISGDIGLHLIGRFARRFRWCARIAQNPAAARAARSLVDNAVAALVIARFVPGTRLPVYVGSGLAQVPAVKASLVIAGASMIWTPALFAFAMLGGLTASRSPGTLTVILLAIAAFSLCAIHLLRRRAGSRGSAVSRKAQICMEGPSA